MLFTTDDVGVSKLVAGKKRLLALNPHLQIDTHEARFSSENALQIVAPYDIVIDGTDNFPTRYCVNDACVMLNKPNVYGSIFRFEGPRPSGVAESRGSNKVACPSKRKIEPYTF